MIDRAGRDRIALALRRYAGKRITNDDLEEAAFADWRDRGAQAVAQLAWNLYSDHEQHRATGRHALDDSVRSDIARWIVFLHSDQEYLWPEMRLSKEDFERAKATPRFFAGEAA